MNKTSRKRKIDENKDHTSSKAPKTIRKIHSTDGKNAIVPKPWTESEFLAEHQHIDISIADNIIKLFDDENTIPFICRYRKELIDDLTPDKLRDIKITINHIKNIKSKAKTMIQKLEKDNQLNDELRVNLLCAKSLDDLEYLYAPYKSTSKASLAERARSIGLEQITNTIIDGKTMANHQLNAMINPKVEGLESIESITSGMKHIASDLISKNSKVLEKIRQLQKFHRIILESSENKKSTVGKVDSKSKDQKPKKPNDPLKYETYFGFKCPISDLKAHQILAINRGENLKFLSVKIIIADNFKSDLFAFIHNEYNIRRMSTFNADFMNSSLEMAYTKKLIPWITRQIRSNLTKRAETASIDVFSSNLKQLLLMPPIKGERILGIDPGFSNGCKMAIISEFATILDTLIIYPHTQRQNNLKYGQAMAKMMQKHNCKLIALGNGTACRETELWITELFAKKILDSNTIQYSIVSEQGSSIYSCGELAKREFPDLDVNLISAISLARRLNDPLSEYVKVEPHHLGVGMYQHDINEKLLIESLNEVVMECVSYVGIDINTSSEELLRHVAGLTLARAKNIIKYRMETGPFTSREEIKKVKQIGEKTFTQCAGFLRIDPHTAGIKNYNKLDSTTVHPESYDLAKKLMKMCKLTISQIGTNAAIESIKKYENENSIDQISNDLNAPKERIKSVLAALQRDLLYDFRESLNTKPLFKKGLTKMSDLRTNALATGAITNITPFGCFVDIGVETNGLIHVSQLNRMKPNIGDRVEVEILSVDVNRNRIQLKLNNLI